MGDACQIRIAVGNLRLSFILSRQPLGLRNDEEALDRTTLAERLTFKPSRPASSSTCVRGTITIDGAGANDLTFVTALETAIAGALSGLVYVGCVSVRSAGGDSRLARFKFDVVVDDVDTVHAVRSVLDAEAASGGARKVMSVLPSALENAGLCSGHLRIVHFE